MTTASASLIAFIVNGAVQVTMIAIGTAVALRLTRHDRAAVKYGIAVAGLALCGTVPLLSLWPAVRVDGLSLVAGPVDANAAADSRSGVLLVSAYLAVVLWKVMSLVRAARAAVALRRTSTPIADGPIRASFDRWHPGAGVLTLRRSPCVTTPLVCGVARPAIVFPDAFPESDPALIDAVMAHEWAHVARRDLGVRIAIEVVTAPVWAHPAVAALTRAAARHREVACDEAAIARLGMSRTAYATLLMRIAEWRVPARVAACGAAGHLEARIRALLRPPRFTRPSAATLVAGCLCVAIVAGMAPFVTVAVDAAWRDLSGAWTLDLEHSEPRGGLPLRAARLRIDAAPDRVSIAQQRTRGDGVAEAFEIRRTTDDVPADVILPGGMVMRTRARWDGGRLVTDSATPDGGWREHLEAIATRDRLVITTESVTASGRRRYAFTFRRE